MSDPFRIAAGDTSSRSDAQHWWADLAAGAGALNNWKDNFGAAVVVTAADPGLNGGFFIAGGIPVDPGLSQGAIAPAGVGSDQAARVAPETANLAPTGITLAKGGQFIENVAGAVVGTLKAVDADVGDTHSFAVNDSRFEVVGDVLKLKDGVRLDFETEPKVTLHVTCTDGGGQTFARNVILSLGDVDEIRFAAFGDFGGGNAMPDVAALIADKQADFIVTTGDNGYDGSQSYDEQIGISYADYIGNYIGAYGAGSDINRFFPSIGNHDYGDVGVGEYLDYFTLPGNELYYDYQMGPVHFFVLDSNSEQADGRDENSVQAQWLQTQLAQSTSSVNIVYFHHAAFSSAHHGSSSTMQWPFEDWGVDAVLTGHDHTYERVLRDDNNDGTVLPYFVTGLGGRSIYDFNTPIDGSEVRYNDDYGTMIIQASDTTMTFEFWSIAGGGTLIDSYTIDLPGSDPSAQNGNDKMHGGSDDDFMNGLSGNDLLWGGAGHDLMIGGEGDDRAFWDIGNDTFNGGSGFDSLDLRSNPNAVIADAAAGTVSSGGETDHFVLVEALTLTKAADEVHGGGTIVRINAAGGNDMVFGGPRAFTALGAGGSDTIVGGARSDDLSGGMGRDVLDGKGGGDTLSGGKGNDVLTGRAGADHFRYLGDDGRDRITDFQDGIDRIDLSGLGLTFADLTVSTYGAGQGTQIAFGTSIIRLEAMTLAQIDGADFIF